MEMYDGQVIYYQREEVVITAPEPTSKRSRLLVPKVEVEVITLSSDEEDSDPDPSVPIPPRGHGLPPLIPAIPDHDYGHSSLFPAIRKGESTACIRKILDEGANVNALTNDFQENAGHLVIHSLIKKLYTPQVALDILILLMEKGFSLVNEGDCKGRTLLHSIMEYEELDATLLNWMFENKGDFNALTYDSNASPLFLAIINRQGMPVLRKVLELGGNPKHVDKFGCNALHVTAAHAYDSPMESFMRLLDVNDGDLRNQTPLHYIFSRDDLDYQHCLKMLLRKGADFLKESDGGDVPLVRWIKEGKGNIFPTLWKLKDRFSIAEDLASATLTAILKGMKRFMKFLPSRFQDVQNEFVQFIQFLCHGKQAKLRLKNDCPWVEHNWGILKHVILKQKFLKELKATKNWIGRFTEISATMKGMLDFHAGLGYDGITVPIETVLLCLLESRDYQGFVEVCRLVEILCC